MPAGTITTCLPALARGGALLLKAEPENPFDPFAVVVETQTGRKLGYVPRCANRELSDWLQAGGQAEARIEDFLLGQPPANEMGELQFTSYTAGDPEIRVTLLEEVLPPTASDPETR